MPQPSLLIIDSHEGARRALAELLCDSGYTVREASNGVDGLGAARQDLPSLVIVDLWPFFSAGLHMLERLRRVPETTGIPVLALTAAVTPEYRTRALAAGCDAYLSKPAPAEEILAEVTRILGQTGGRE